MAAAMVKARSRGGALRSSSIDTRLGPIEALIAGEGPALLSLHGSPGGCGQALAFAAHFRDGDLRVIAPSRPGYGRTPLDSGRGFERQADLLDALLETIGVGRAAVYAVSGGGPVALQLAVRHPDRIAAIVLEDAVTERLHESPLDRIGDLLTFSRPLLRLFSSQARRDPQRVIAGVLASTSDLGRDRSGEIAAAIVGRPGMRAWLEELVPNLASRRHWRGYRNDIDQIDELPRYPLERIEAPALVCHGLADSEVPIAHARNAAARMPAAELLEVPDAGHILALSERGEEVRARQLGFIRDHAR